MDGCIFCGKGPMQGVSLFRLNAKGEPGKWACREHIKNTDIAVDPTVQRIVDVINPTR